MSTLIQASTKFNNNLTYALRSAAAYPFGAHVLTPPSIFANPSTASPPRTIPTATIIITPFEHGCASQGGAYDAVGNRLTQTNMVSGLSSVVDYAYDDANRLTSVNGVTYTWDNNGNLLNDGVNTYTYDAANRLKSITGASTANFAYNGLGDRLSQNGVNYTLDLNTSLTQVLSDGTNTYLYGVGRIAQVNASTEYFLGDALGSVRQLTNNSGAVTYARAYDPYGVTTQTYGTSQTAYGYTGEFTSQGLVFLRARMYSPSMGRFLTRDTWRGDANQPLSLNKWNYVSGNPTNETDPTGLCEEIGDEACWAVYEEIIRWRPDLANATISTSAGEIPLYKASYARLKYFLENNLWSCLTTPDTGAENYAFYNSCNASAWVDQHRNEIIGAAQRHGVPPELVAGTLASELDFDYDLTDMLGDLAMEAGGDSYIAWYLENISSDPGPGVASIHLSTWEIVQKYYLDCGYDLGTTLAPNGQTLSQIGWIKTALTPTGSIESASAVVRFLADYRTGSNNLPNKTTHYNDLRTLDMAQIFGAYRRGVGGLNCFRDDDGDGLLDCGFQNIRLFQTTDNLGSEAQQAHPYFEFFQQYFEYYRRQDK